MGILTPIPQECLRRWTALAVKCYFSGCKCSNCHILDNCESITPAKCRMKSVALGLVKKFGKPENESKYY